MTPRPQTDATADTAQANPRGPAPPGNALSVAQAYVSFIEAKDREAIARSLADGVEQTFPIGVEANGDPMALFVGKDEVLDYTYGLFRKFSTLRWPSPQWSEATDGRTAFLEGRGDATVAHSGEHYSNVYITRFDVEDGLIVSIKEYANPTLYVSLGIEPSPVELKATGRCQASQ